MNGKLSARELIFNLIDAADDVSPPSSNEVTADLIAAMLGVSDFTMDEVREALDIYRQLQGPAARTAPENVDTPNRQATTANGGAMTNQGNDA